MTKQAELTVFWLELVLSVLVLSSPSFKNALLAPGEPGIPSDDSGLWLSPSLFKAPMVEFGVLGKDIKVYLLPLVELVPLEVPPLWDLLNWACWLMLSLAELSLCWLMWVRLDLYLSAESLDWTVLWDNWLRATDSCVSRCLILSEFFFFSVSKIWTWQRKKLFKYDKNYTQASLIIQWPHQNFYYYYLYFSSFLFFLYLCLFVYLFLWSA